MKMINIPYKLIKDKNPAHRQKLPKIKILGSTYNHQAKDFNPWLTAKVASRRLIKNGVPLRDLLYEP